MLAVVTAVLVHSFTSSGIVGECMAFMDGEKNPLAAVGVDAEKTHDENVEVWNGV